MKIIAKIPLLCAALLLCGACAGVHGPEADFEYHVCAFVWPSCHRDSLAEQYLWPEGIGEWEMIKKAEPRFPGHYQPKQPLWGYEMDDDPAVVEKWIQTALKYGVNTFIYDWYWFMDYPFLEGALDNGFLKAPSHDKMEFYIMWANHYVPYKMWNWHKYGPDNADILFDPKVNWDQWKVIVDRIINSYFVQPNYTKIDGKPVFAIFNFDNFIDSFGNDPVEARKAIDYLRAEVMKAGFPGIHLQHTVGSPYKLQEEDIVRERRSNEILGIDSYGFYGVNYPYNSDYLEYCANGRARREEWRDSLNVPVFPTVGIGWDDTPRYPWKGIEYIVYYHKTPKAFACALKEAKDYADAHADTQPKFILLNAWNEWIEGNYLLPDKLNGYGYLQAVRDVMDGKYD